MQKKFRIRANKLSYRFRITPISITINYLPDVKGITFELFNFYISFLVETTYDKHIVCANCNDSGVVKTGEDEYSSCPCTDRD